MIVLDTEESRRERTRKKTNTKADVNARRRGEVRAKSAE